eukprot:GFYU01020041.1.p1 GENE.GFYU01020041.1~~GFYU01020041.1.p1  ORF type:complete len:610 (-),score=252.27 GFYU01020041.1:128-1894(-)
MAGEGLDEKAILKKLEDNYFARIKVGEEYSDNKKAAFAKESAGKLEGLLKEVASVVKVSNADVKKLAKRFYAGDGDAQSSEGEEEDDDDGSDAQEGTQNDGWLKSVSGVPLYWLHTLLRHPAWADELSDNDRKVLVYLQDIQLKTTSNGFRLEFTFEGNPYFSNKTLSKEYTYTAGAVDKIAEITGCEVKWNAGKDVTIAQITKKVKAKGAKKKEEQTKTKSVASFFNFFKVTGTPGVEGLGTVDQATFDKVIKLELDSELAVNFKDEIIKHSYAYYCGGHPDARDLLEEDHDVYDVLKEIPCIQQRLEKLNEVEDKVCGIDKKAKDGLKKVDEDYFKKLNKVYEERRGLTKLIPQFWKKVLCRHEDFLSLMTKRDMDCLSFLNDISVPFADNNGEGHGHGSGYTITFTFDPNEFFEQTTLTKTYKWKKGAFVGATATGIKWKEGHALNLKYKKGQDEDGNEVTVEKPCETFFEFFAPIKFEKNLSQEEKRACVFDVELGELMLEGVYPDAVKYYTGDLGADYEEPEDVDSSDDDDSDDEMDGKRISLKGKSKKTTWTWGAIFKYLVVFIMVFGEIIYLLLKFNQPGL